MTRSSRRRSREMVGTLRPGGWFVIDFLNAAAVRARLVPQRDSGRHGW